MRFIIRYSCLSHIGKRRSKNQDNVLFAGQYLEANTKSFFLPSLAEYAVGRPILFGIFDGLGGEERGEFASYLAAREAAAFPIGRQTAKSLF